MENKKSFKQIFGDEQPEGVIQFLDDLAINKTISEDVLEKVSNMNETELREFIYNYNSNNNK